ncbi:secondary thiamine-phosphate synthase enzyme YjbQ [Hyphococcus lacteus]|uniref:Secondary thiamine-phosphate synthase enzyme YjbQ n=1 Tax=Hyphococcus lacteus TaxID=3143536 RepID=A0ABV3Z3R6_9PROT
MSSIISVRTRGHSVTEITPQVENEVAKSGMDKGLVHLFIQHTSASLTIQENADPDVTHDLISWLDQTVPESGPYRHTAEGPDDMPAHIKSMITNTSLIIPFANGQLLTGTWQGIFVLEHRRADHQRRIVVTLMNEA